MGLLPLAWLALRRERRKEWWWLAAALGISWCADTVALWLRSHHSPDLPAAAGAELVSAIYPMAQAALIGAVLLPRPAALHFLAFLVVAAYASLAARQIPELLLHTVAWLGIVAATRGRWDLLADALRLAFGVGWLAWLLYVLDPGWGTWGLFQGLRGAGLGLFCLANARMAPSLRLT